MILTVFTEQYPKGTLGNISAASKMIKLLQAKDPTLEIQWVIIEPYGEKPIAGVIPSNVQLFLIENWSEINSETSLKSALKKSDMFLTFPEIGYQKEDLAMNLQQFKQPHVLCRQYDFPTKKNLSNIIEVGSGLGEGNIGIFMGSHHDKYPLTRAIEHGGENVVNHLLQYDVEKISADQVEKLEKEYSQNNNLFVCYFNRQDGNNYEIVSRVNYCYLSILKSLSESPEKNIDLIVNMSENEFTELNDILTNPKNSLYDSRFSNIHLHEFKSAETHSHNTKKVNIRVINDFPYPPDVFECLVQASHAFSGMTGDQSMSKALSLDKCVFYQTMSWKQAFATHFLTFVEQTVGKNSVLYQFYFLQTLEHIKRNMRGGVMLSHKKKEILNQIADLLINSSDELNEQAKIVRDRLEKEKNLTSNLPDKVMEILNESKLIAAVKKGDISLVQMLLKENVTPNTVDSTGNSALFWAIYHQQDAVAELLIEQGANIQPELSVALDKASDYMWQKLMEKGLDINQPNQNGSTKVMWAAQKGFKDIVERLCSSGADLSLKDKNNQTVFDYALKSPHPETILDVLNASNTPKLKRKF